MKQVLQNCRSGHAVALGIVLVEVRPGWALFKLEWRDELLSRSNSLLLASAPIVSLMECACSHAIWSALERPLSSITLSLRVDHLRPAKTGRQLFGQAECFRVSKRIAFARGIAHDGDERDPVADATASFFYAKED